GKFNDRIRRERLFCNIYTRADGSRAVITFSLWKIQRVFPFDTSGAHIVADGVSHDISAGGNDQRQLRFGDIPTRIFPDPDLPTVSNCSGFCSFEKKLRTFGPVYALVEIGPARLLGFFLPAQLAVIVGHPAGPDLLAFNRGFQLTGKKIRT